MINIIAVIINSSFMMEQFIPSFIGYDFNNYWIRGYLKWICF